MYKSFTGRDPLSGESLVVHCADGRIVFIEPGAHDETAWIAPGLMDLQVNGFLGDDFNADDLTSDAVQRLARHILATGVTTFLPTIITASEEKIIHNLKCTALRRAASLCCQSDYQK